jgi:2-C-methyl-D-erythritol 4-phosphate cytidylyltransferase/2-C-methyl-D-erythritol 2,4-cyclodiphosphate synthase
LAAGSGVRYGKGDKLWQVLLGAPVWRHAVWRLLSHPEVASGTLAVAPDNAAPFEAYLQRFPAPKPLRILPCGGATRQATVRNALAHLPDGVRFVAVHDAARPLVSHALLDRLIATAMQYGTAIPALPVQDTLKRADDGRTVQATVPREGLYRVQTPQVFRADWLIEAHRRAAEEGFEQATDDAQLLERAGYPVHLVDGDPRNLKLTTPDDLHLLRLHIGEGALTRTGIGYDIHQLTEGRTLMLGGVAIEYPYGLQGHSDADVVLHAICDALLGAAALGDIGQHFPNTDPRWKDASSLTLLQQVRTMLAQHGWQPLNIDAMALAEAPKLAPYIPEMRQRIAHTLGILPEQVSIKATTNEGMDAVGARRAIACYAVAAIYPANGEADHEQIPTQTG